jgi:hypothetical protein
VNVFKYTLAVVCMFTISCGREKAAKSIGKQDSANAIEYQLVSDGRFFSKPVRLPTGEVTDGQRERFAKELESAIDGAKTNYKVDAVRAEAPGKVVIALYARGGMTRAECESLAQSEGSPARHGYWLQNVCLRGQVKPPFFSRPLSRASGVRLLLTRKVRSRLYQSDE